MFGVEANADKIGLVTAGAVGLGIAAHAAISVSKHKPTETQNKDSL